MEYSGLVGGDSSIDGGETMGDCTALICEMINKNFSERGIKLLTERYIRRGVETPCGTMWRVARCVAGGDEKLAITFITKLLAANRFLPNTPTWTGAGVGKGQLAACFVLPVDDTMESIFGTLRDAALIQSTGGGTGFTFGHLRPKNSAVASSQSESSGPVSFIKAYDSVFSVVQQGGVRRGANMGIMPVSHPDIFEFIKCKEKEGEITNFNLSVSVNDEFMNAVVQNAQWKLSDPSTGAVVCDVPARRIFDAIVDGAYRNGEPGIVFEDTINSDNPCPSVHRIEATNPCVTGDCIIPTTEGLMLVDDLVGRDFTTPDGARVPGGFYMTDRVSTIVKITTTCGFELSCTENHRILTRGGDSCWVKVSDLKRGMSVLVVGGMYAGMSRVESTTVPPSWIKSVAPLIASGDVAGLREREHGCCDVSSLVRNIRSLDMLGAAVFIYNLHVACGRPLCGVVFYRRTPDEIITTVQLILLSFDIVTRRGEMFGEIYLRAVVKSGIEKLRWITGNGDIGGLTPRAVSDWVSSNVHQSMNIDEIASMERVEADVGCGINVYDVTVDPTHERSPQYWTGAFISHNCSEVPLFPYESCCLGSINLANHVSDDGKVDWDLLRETVELGTLFLNKVIDANKFVPAVPQLKIAAKNTGRIGLGVMGLADVFFKMRIGYGSDESLSVAGQIMEFVRYHAMRTSCRLAIEHGPFPLYDRSTYKDGTWRPPKTGPTKCFVDIGREGQLNWDDVAEMTRLLGVRNITTTAIAPTGTLSMVAGVSGFGCEPVFALVHKRRITYPGGGVRYEEMIVPELLKAIETHPELVNDEAKRNDVLAWIKRTGSCRGNANVPRDIANVFVCAGDITVAQHITMQSELQRYVDGAISKTVNLPSGSSRADVESAIMLAWTSRCKGICVYVSGSRELQVLTPGFVPASNNDTSIKP